MPLLYAFVQDTFLLLYTVTHSSILDILRSLDHFVVVVAPRSPLVRLLSVLLTVSAFAPERGTHVQILITQPILCCLRVDIFRSAPSLPHSTPDCTHLPLDDTPESKSQF